MEQASKYLKEVSERLAHFSSLGLQFPTLAEFRSSLRPSVHEPILTILLEM
jgi:hypothetical protein